MASIFSKEENHMIFSQFSQEEFETVIYTLNDYMRYNHEYATSSRDYWISDVYDSYLSPVDGKLNLIVKLIPYGDTIANATTMKFIRVTSSRGNLRTNQMITKLLMEVSNRLALC